MSVDDDLIKFNHDVETYNDKFDEQIKKQNEILYALLCEVKQIRECLIISDDEFIRKVEEGIAAVDKGEVTDFDKIKKNLLKKEKK